VTPYRDINDEEWQRVAPLQPELRPRSEPRGRPLANTRSVLNGVLWVVSRRHVVLDATPLPVVPDVSCRFKVWYESGVLKRLMDELYGAAAEELCATMQARMRIHPTCEEKSARLGSGFAAHAEAVHIPPVHEVTPQAAPHTLPYKHAA